MSVPSMWSMTFPEDPSQGPDESPSQGPFGTPPPPAPTERDQRAPYGSPPPPPAPADRHAFGPYTSAPPPIPPTERHPHAAFGEPPAGAPSAPVIRRPLAAAILVIVFAAFGGAALAHFLWPSNTTSSSLGLVPGFSSGLPSGGGFNRVLPQTNGGSNVVTPAADAAVASRIDPGLVDVNTETSSGAAAGTGMVVTANGEVITNNHVISGATAISVYDIGNGRTYSAKVVGYDRSQDVAVIQLQGASGLSTVPLGNSSTLHVGSAVVTIGNAGGVGGTPSVAGGSVAALDRSITAGDSYEAGNTERLKGVIQINGSLEPGDSGGPLVSGGKVVGMDTAASTNFSFQSSSSGQGFAIPINQVVTIASRIVAGQSSSVIHIGATALIGVYVSNTSKCVNETTGVTGGGSGAAGALVCGVVRGTPAASTGLASSGLNSNAYDTITGLAGRSVTSAASLLSLMDTHHPGDRVTLTWVDPSGNSHSATITLVSGPAD
jgi:S1-C subfamily serine protease